MRRGRPHWRERKPGCTAFPAGMSMQSSRWNRYPCARVEKVRAAHRAVPRGSPFPEGGTTHEPPPASRAPKSPGISSR
ncbi:protein of unknown function [Methanoculleus bourgensis]|uniref:Uncharacterized protein n=1 Tax=Methanoculleus bourgensis TaxID=83986 RepID=A0A0X3BKR5_9EURY|nr:protein of unknown function [Methanoculleus bourgensis]